MSAPTGAFHSIFIQITKVTMYGWLGALPFSSILEGLSAGLGAVIAIYVMRNWLLRFSEVWFRRLAVLLMLLSGLSLLWHSFRSLI